MLIMSEKIRISCVSYTNMAPMVYGLERTDFRNKVELSYDVPSMCAEKLKSGAADIGIIPVGALLDLPDYEIVSDYCLGADGPVDSVFIFSQKPISEIKTLRLDDQSRSSNGLARLLLSEYWGRNDVQIKKEGDADAFVQIGDRTFGQKDKYPYYYDMAEEWKKFTGLPFAFAVWVSTKPLTDEFVHDFNEALGFGVARRAEVIAQLPPRSDFDLEYNLTHHIDYRLDAAKRHAMSKYLSWLKLFS